MVLDDGLQLSMTDPWNCFEYQVSEGHEDVRADNHPEDSDGVAEEAGGANTKNEPGGEAKEERNSLYRHRIGTLLNGFHVLLLQSNPQRSLEMRLSCTVLRPPAAVVRLDVLVI